MDVKLDESYPFFFRLPGFFMYLTYSYFNGSCLLAFILKSIYAARIGQYFKYVHIFW